MAIGWKDIDEDSVNTGSTSVKDSDVSDLSSLKQDSNGKLKNNKGLFIIVAIIILIIAAVVNMLGRSETTEFVDEPDLIESDISSTELNITKEEKEEEASTIEGAIYDEDGNLISTNGVYDQNGNIISENEDVIDAGLPDFENSTNNTTTAIVYSDSDFIKDLNGVGIPAIYNVRSRDYVKDFVNYEAKRAIIDDGMEMYWLEVEYHEKHYRVQVPFYVFKDLDKTGICVVEIELLTLEGGEKVVSYMQVITDYSNLE